MDFILYSFASEMSFSCCVDLTGYFCVGMGVMAAVGIGIHLNILYIEEGPVRIVRTLLKYPKYLWIFVPKYLRMLLVPEILWNCFL